MTKAELYTFVTSLLDDFAMETTLFDSFLDIAQMRRENARPWVVLRKEDTSQTIATNNTFETQKSLPSDFRKWYNRFPIKFSDSSSNLQGMLREVPLEDKLVFKDDNSRFYCDYAASKFYVCGAPSQSLTIRQYYIKKGVKVSLNDNNTWSGFEEFDKILGLDIAVYHKLGVDYDIINNSQGNANAAAANNIFEMMSEWDNELQLSTRQGIDYSMQNAAPSGQNGGNVNYLI